MGPAHRSLGAGERKVRTPTSTVLPNGKIQVTE